jgi:uncharacterized protein YeeX (DUF496 family)
VCDAHYTITDAVSYGCSSYHDGHACSNSIRVRRDRVERVLLGPIRDDLLAPERVARMVKEMEDHYRERVQASQARTAEAPRELQELAARIERLRERLQRGDPDMRPTSFRPPSIGRRRSAASFKSHGAGQDYRTRPSRSCPERQSYTAVRWHLASTAIRTPS